MSIGFLLVILHTLAAVVAAAVLFFGIPFAIFLGEANARGQPLVSRGFDRVAALVFYLSWFGLLWQFGLGPFSWWPAAPPWRSASSTPSATRLRKGGFAGIPLRPRRSHSAMGA
jgi:hypothetical protein